MTVISDNHSWVLVREHGDFVVNNKQQRRNMVGGTARLFKLCRYIGPTNQWPTWTCSTDIVFEDRFFRSLFMTFSELSSKLCWVTFRNIKLSGFDKMFIISLFHYRVRGFMMLSSSLGNSFFPSSWHFGSDVYAWWMRTRWSLPQLSRSDVMEENQRSEKKNNLLALSVFSLFPQSCSSACTGMCREYILVQ